MHIPYLTLTMTSFYLQDFQVLFPRVRISQFPLAGLCPSASEDFQPSKQCCKRKAFSYLGEVSSLDALLYHWSVCFFNPKVLRPMIDVYFF